MSTYLSHTHTDRHRHQMKSISPQIMYIFEWFHNLAKNKKIRKLLLVLLRQKTEQMALSLSTSTPWTEHFIPIIMEVWACLFL